MTDKMLSRLLLLFLGCVLCSCASEDPDEASLMCASAHISHSVRVGVEGIDALPERSELVLESEKLTFECELLTEPLRLEPEVCTPDSFSAMIGVGEKDAALSIVITTFSWRAASWKITIRDDSEVLLSETLTPDYERTDEPNGPGCGFRYEAEVTVTIDD